MRKPRINPALSPDLQDHWQWVTQNGIWFQSARKVARLLASNDWKSLGFLCICIKIGIAYYISKAVSTKPNENLTSHKGRAIFSCDQAALWMVQSVRLSVRPSVCLSVRPSVCLSHLFDYVPIILSSWNFQELLPVTKVTSMQKVKVRGQRSRSQRSQPNLTVSGL